MDLTPNNNSGDGTFTQVTVAGQPVWQNTGTAGYLYGKRPTSFAFTAGQTLYVRVNYYDDLGGGGLDIQYDAQTASYTYPVISTRTSRVGTGQFVDGYFELPNVFFGGRENGGSDFRIIGGAPGGVKISIRKITLSDTPFDNPDFQLAITRSSLKRYTGPAKDYVDVTTLKGKVMAGYQGWFRTPNDLYDAGWRHWVGGTMAPENFQIDMWPDLTEYDPASLFRAGTVMTKGGAPAYLFSSASYPAVQKHFRWMRKHNIDGAWVQRFSPNAGSTPEWILHNVSQAAAEEGRIWAVEYDVSSLTEANVVAKLQADWAWLTSTTGFDILNDPRYAREGGKPVVFIWGFPFADRGFTPATANAAVDYFIAQGAHVIGGIPNSWSSLSATWQTHIAKYDGILVWQNQTISDGAFFRNRGQDFYPHLWPGFSWANLKKLPANPPSEYTDRSGGQFYWTKGRDWINGGADRLFIGMFDEYDEGTAIMPMTDDPPDPSASYGRFLDNQGKPSDWWMVLTDELKRMMFAQRTNTNTLPTVASLSNRSNIGPEASVDLGTTDIAASLSRVQQSDGDTIVETVGGKECRGNLDPATDRYMYFNVNNSFAYQLANGDVTIEVEYYDANTSTVLGLQYDSTSSVPTNPAYTTHPQSITTTGSNIWRTVRFEIADAFFGGRENGGADFRLNFNGKKLNVNRVWVRLPEVKAFPFTWTNANAGPALTWSQNANWLGAIVAPSDLTSTVQIFPGQTMVGGSIAIANNTSGGQQIGVLQLGGAASSTAATTVTLSGNAINLGGSAPSITLDATKSAFDFTYDIATPVALLGTTQITGDGNATFRISGAIGGTAGLIKTGSSTLALAGAATYTGATTLSTGRLALTGSLTSAITASGGTFAPLGAPSTSGGLDIAGGGRLEVRLNGATPGTQYDQLTVGDGVNLAGSLDVITGPNLAPGSSFIILNKTSAGAVSGTFAGKAENSTFVNASAYTFRINYNAGTGNDVVLTLITSPIEQWRFTNFGSMLNTGIGLANADNDGDGIANLIEYATRMNPALSDVVPQSTARSGSTLDFIYTKNKAATDITYTVEWSDMLLNEWSTTGVSAPTVLSDNGTTQQIKVTVPAGSGVTRRFVHLKVTRP